MIKYITALCLTLCSGLGAQQSLVDANFANWTISTSMSTSLGGYLVILSNTGSSSNFATLTSPLFSYTDSCGDTQRRLRYSIRSSGEQTAFIIPSSVRLQTAGAGAFNQRVMLPGDNAVHGIWNSAPVTSLYMEMYLVVPANTNLVIYAPSVAETCGASAEVSTNDNAAQMRLDITAGKEYPTHPYRFLFWAPSIYSAPIPIPGWSGVGAWVNPIVSLNMTSDTATLTTSAMINQAVRSGYWQVLDAPTGLTPNMGHYFR